MSGPTVAAPWTLSPAQGSIIRGLAYELMMDTQYLKDFQQGACTLRLLSHEVYESNRVTAHQRSIDPDLLFDRHNANLHLSSSPRHNLYSALFVELHSAQ